MYFLVIQPALDKILQKLFKRNRKQYEMVVNKMDEVVKNPNHAYKFLHESLQGFNRIHIDKHFVLLFQIGHAKREVICYYYDHHDKIYNWRPT